MPKSVIDQLNTILTNELTAINQYFLHSRILKDWGFTKLADREYAASIDEMKHADELTQRILFLKGLPFFQPSTKLTIGKTVKEILQSDLALELQAIPVLKNAIHLAEVEKDFGSRDLMQKILFSEEEHINWLEIQLDLISKLGEANYLQSQV